MNILLTFIYFLIVLTIVVFIHEFGHYYVAKKCGVKIVEFSIGMGKKLFGFKDKNGCEWKFCLIPLGGYVQMYGDDNATSFSVYKESPTEDELKYSLIYKHPLKKIAVAFAGPFMNFVLSFFLFLFIFCSHGKPVIEPVIGEVLKSSYAEKSGILANDVILSVNGKKIETFSDISYNLQYSTGNKKDVEIEILRDNKKIKINAQYKKNEVFGIKSKESNKFKKLLFTTSIKDSVYNIYDLSFKTGKALFNMVVHQNGFKNIGGPIAIAKESGRAGAQGFWSLLYFISLISVILGATNLIPIPPLDGGQIVVNFAELITRRRFSNKVYKILVYIGFGFVACLMALGFINDLFINR